MKKNFLKKIAIALTATVMAAAAVLAPAKEVKAAETTKTVYLKVAEDGNYEWGAWSSGTGYSFDGEAAEGWKYAFTKVENGLYKIEVKITDTVKLSGVEIFKDGTQIAKMDVEWGSSVPGKALEDALNGDKAIITLSEYDATSWAFNKVETSAAEDDKKPDDTPKTGDMTAVLPVAVLAVAAMTVVVVMKKKAITE